MGALQTLAALWLVVFSTCARAGYMSVSITQPVQCGNLSVSWTGDSGPYHLLITPTDIVQHGYNVWVPSIPANQTSYNFTLRQPAGLPLMVTVWGASGIEFAGSSDINTVAPSNNSACFLSDQEILNLYTFSFNITDSFLGYPPQCSNLSMTWPTALESNVTGTTAKRATDLDLSPRTDTLLERDPSSSNDGGNTTIPPSMFGLIPLGNSFNIPITYSPRSRFAKTLPEEYISDTPTTYTSQGITRLNWTVEMAKGTRFILVAGIGSAQQWASGGSSRLLTVGQGGTTCVGANGGDAAPSVTVSTSASSTPTGGENTDLPPPSSTPSSPSYVRVIIACILSAVGTLVLVGLFYFIRRVRRRRREEAAAAVTYPAGKGKGGRIEPFLGRSSTSTQLDLIASRSSDPAMLGRRESSGNSPTNPSSPVSLNNDPFRTPIDGPDTRSPYHSDPIRQDAYPVSPIRERPELTLATNGRQMSQEGLLAYAARTNLTSSGSPVSSPMYSSSRNRGPLGAAGYEEIEEEDISELKRDTLATLGATPTTSTSTPPAGTFRSLPTSSDRRPTYPLITTGAPQPPRSSMSMSGRGTAPRRRRTQDAELEYVVHRDAGRVQRVELPPRYEELDWEREGREGLEGGEPESATVASPTHDPATPVHQDHGHTT